MDSNIRNFSIIAHIDHGKSTLADRMLEATNTVESRKMKEQLLDQMELERERGITIKMKPVRMLYNLDGSDYVLNLIDTPGHIDFSYEVSRALKAVEGVVLLIDATQGIQAQTLSTLEMARKEELTIIPVLNKIDLPSANVEETKMEIEKVLGVSGEDILTVSAKSGQGVSELLREIIKKVPPPKKGEQNKLKSLIFDFEYGTHQGVIIYVRIFDGVVNKNDELIALGARQNLKAQDIGIFSPNKVSKNTLSAGEIGYIVTGIKKQGLVYVGDTISERKEHSDVIPGFEVPKSVVWASIYPEGQDDFSLLRQALLRLKLEDASLVFEEENSPTLGRGFRCGFLGMLHLEIIAERLKRESNLELVLASPTVSYEVEYKDSKREAIYSPSKFPDHGSYVSAYEPWVNLTIVTPRIYLGSVLQLVPTHEGTVNGTEALSGDRLSLKVELPLRELMRNFFDELKSISSGYASLSYEWGEMKIANVVRMDILVANERVEAFTRVVSRKRVDKDSQDLVDRLKEVLPRQQFPVKVQAMALGRIIASRTISALRKDVTGYLYGGDVTRKKKLLEKQKKGKNKMKEKGKIRIPQSVFLRVMRDS